MLKLPIVEFHILQSFPVCCLNRDDVGSPKIAVIGGVTRSRVSSQCWKRAIRMKMQELNPTLISTRIKYLSTFLADECKRTKINTDETKIRKATDTLAKQITADRGIIALSKSEIERLLNMLQEIDFSSKEADYKKLIELLVEEHKINSLQNSADVALFGRMIAKQQELNVEGACSVAHAITTHRAGTELDYYTAIADNTNEMENGAGFVGISEYTAGTFYRYICLDLHQLATNLYGDNFTKQGLSKQELINIKDVIKYFVLALFSAVPTGRQNTMTAMCPWNYAQILVRDGQGIQVSFDRPVKADNGYLNPSIEYLKDKINAYRAMFGEKLFGEKCSIEFKDDGQTSVDDLIKKICEAF